MYDYECTFNKCSNPTIQLELKVLFDRLTRSWLQCPPLFGASRRVRGYPRYRRAFGVSVNRAAGCQGADLVTAPKIVNIIFLRRPWLHCTGGRGVAFWHQVYGAVSPRPATSSMKMSWEYPVYSGAGLRDGCVSISPHHMLEKSYYAHNSLFPESADQHH